MKKKNFLRAFNFSTRPVHAGFLLLGLLTAACGTGEQDKSKDGNGGSATEKSEAEMNEGSDSKRPLYQGNAKFIEELFALSDCDREEPGIVEPTGPVTCSQVLDALHVFCETYRAGGQFNYFPTKIEMHSAIGDLFGAMARTEFGLVFHYGYHSADEEIVYLLSKGKLDTSVDSTGTVSYCAFAAGDTPNSQDDHYLLLKSGSGQPYEILDKTEFEGFRNEYAVNVQRFDGNDYVDIDTSNNPLMVYHDPAGLLEFYEKYKDENNASLYIAHGSIRAEGASEAYHTPCFVFGNDTAFFELDNRDYSSNGSNNMYTKKGLDIGHLCPPNCREPITPCVGK